MAFTVTDGRDTWTVTLVEGDRPGARLCLFVGDLPPRHVDLWVVNHTVSLGRRDQNADAPGGVICFTPGTVIRTEDGAKPVEAIREGDRIQTKDNGCEPVLWTGRRRMTGARLHAMPHLSPVRLRAGALEAGVPDAGLLVSPDHRILLRGARARALFCTEEVLVAARDLVDDRTITIDRSLREVTYIHLLLPHHQVVFANGVETESYHPASAGLETLRAEDRARLFGELPEIRDDPTLYGSYARRVLSASEATILRAA